MGSSGSKALCCLSLSPYNPYRSVVVFLFEIAPVTEAFRQSIGADIYTVDAASASDTAVEVFRKRAG